MQINLEIEHILGSTGQFIVAKDRNSRYLYCNELYAEYLDLDSPASLVGKNDADFFPASLSNIFRWGDVHTMKGGLFINVPEILIRNEEIISILTTKNRLKNKNDETVGTVVSVLNLSALATTPPPEQLPQVSDENLYQYIIENNCDFFTPREFEVFKYIFLGYYSKQIAKKLNISSKTVEYHIEKIKNKLQCSHKNYIIEAAMRFGLISQSFPDFSE